MNLDDQVILAAVNAAGPQNQSVNDDGNPDLGVWRANVESAAVQIAVMLGERSSIRKSVEAIADCKVFTATILKVSKEKTSSRGLVELKTKPSTHYPDGIETARTERTDSDLTALQFAKTLQGLVGHRVVVWVQLQVFGDSDHKVRVIKHVEDLGVDAAVEDDD